MSRTIDPATPVEDLTDDEVGYLYDRDDPRVSTAEMQRRGMDPYGPENPARYLVDQPNFGDANTKGVSAADLDPGEDYEEGLKPKQENLTKPQLRGEDEEDEEEIEVPDNTDYASDEWNNDKRRAELADRGLSVEGNKADLIARLEEDDRRKASA